MDADRYARVRELFLAVEELPPSEQLDYLKSQAGDDQELIDEVRSLLSEHDAELARMEGESAKSLLPPANDPAVAANGFVLSDEVAALSDGSEATSATVNSGTKQGDSATFRSHPDSKHAAARRRANEDSKSSAAKPASGAQITQHGSQRTHASPRDFDAPSTAKKSKEKEFWQHRARRHRRFNSGWLWFAALLPTALVGWWTYHQVNESLQNAIGNELNGVANSVSISVDQFLSDKAKLTESWARQPVIRQSVMELLEIAKQPDANAKLKTAEQNDLILHQLQELSGRENVKFVVWAPAGKILASWLPDRADVGGSIAPSGAANLNRAMRGETVLFGPEILRDESNGFVPETSVPVMAEIVPVRDDDNEVVAVMLVRGFGMFADFDRLFRQAAEAGGLDVYAVSRDGTMITNSPQASVLAAQGVLAAKESEIAAQLRVSDPGVELTRGSSKGNRMAQALTYAAAGASSGQENLQLSPYRNYAGIPVVGAWRWQPRWQIGMVIERSAKSAFSTARIVRFGFLMLGALLSVTAFIAATQIAKRTALAQAATHPLNRYELLSELGSGGMGVVYKARHKQLGRDAALKVLRSDRQNRDDRLRFDREAKLAASLSNPHTVTIYDYGRSDEDEAFCVMEFLTGITLYDVVSRSGHQYFGRVLFILRQICDSLGEAHALELVHRDIKPQNVMLSFDPSVGDWAVVFDFGLAKPLTPDAGSYQTAETIWAGTPMYMAPERYREPNKIDPRSDIYSVGCIAYYLLSGRPPFIECDPESLFALVLTEQPISIATHRDESVPDDINEMVAKCMAKSVDDRFSSIDELAARLDELRQQYSWTVHEAAGWWRIHGSEV
ncbi:serine/threonine protein kinase [Stieleria varia]|uniref:Serine/threonine-protein kinase PknB n=1 Tax=Stieleria varia TaxID=2528005 RepID=A0A5C6B0B8_9BACT|nr:serine/threonine protein kinase [Stieleria varia]TWU04899.1 Serine/threonine-protein kinase PknB [Stieleria varia]